MSLRLPLVFWNEPPELSFSSCLITKSLTKIVTGTHGGLCVLWTITDADSDDVQLNSPSGSVSEEQSELSGTVEPFAVLSGHETTVTAMCECSYDYTPAVCSVSTDGTLCVWNVSDGRCMATSPFLLNSSPVHIVALPGDVKVACIGKHNNIDIIDLSTLKVQRTLEGHTEWVTSLSCGLIRENNETSSILLSVSEDRTMRYWMFDNFTGDQMPAYSIDCHTDKPVCVSQNEDWSYVMIVSEKGWMLFKYHSYKPYLAVPCPENTTLKGGFFIDTTHVLIYTQDGDAYVYEIPREERVKSKRARFSLNPVADVSPPPTSPTHSHHSGSVVTGDDIAATPQTAPQGGFSDFLAALGVKKKEASTSKAAVKISDEYTSASYDSTIASAIEKARSTSIISSQDAQPPALSAFAAAVASSITDASPDYAAAAPTFNVNGDEGVNPAPKTILKKKSDRIVAASAAGNVKLVQILKDRSMKSSLSTSVWMCEGNIVLKVDTNGNLQVWKIFLKSVSDDRDDVPSAPHEKAADTMQWNKLSVDHQKLRHHSDCLLTPDEMRIEKMSTTTLASGWPKTCFGETSRISASHFAIDSDFPPLLVHGFEDGKIEITSSMRTVEPIIINAHTHKVTSLLVFEESDRRLLISGSADCTVKIWNMENGELIKTFHLHSASVALLFTPPKVIRKKLQNCFCSVGEDRSIVVYSIKNMECLHVLGGHPSTIVGVYFRIDLDYLLVRCSDGLVYVWQLSTGVLERRVSGKIAADLVERSEGQGCSRRKTIKISFSNQTSPIEDSRKGFMDCLSLSVNDREPDVQVVMLSIRRVIAQIIHERESIERFFTERKRDTLPLSYALTTTLSYILQYGDCESLNKLRKLLCIESPRPEAYIGLKGAGNTFALIVPKASDSLHPFVFSPVLTALHTISCVSILGALSAIPALTDLCKTSSDYYLTTVPSSLKSYSEPSFLWCAQFLKDSSRDIQNGARAVMSAVMERSSNASTKTLADKLANYLIESREASSRKQNLVVALAVLCIKSKVAIDPKIITIVTMGLIEILETGGPQHGTAISLIGDGFVKWKQQIPDQIALMRQLFQLAMPALLEIKSCPALLVASSSAGFFAEPVAETTSASSSIPATPAPMPLLTLTPPSAPGPTPNPSLSDLFNTGKVTQVAIDALSAFASIASVDTKTYIDFIHSIIANAQHTPHKTLRAAIASFNPLIRKYPNCIVNFLVPMTSMLMKVLDPHFIETRFACQPDTTDIMRYMSAAFPMVCYHQEKQQLAVGNHEGVVVVYSLRSASKLVLFQVSKQEIGALAFSHGGDMIACFVPKDAECKVCNVETNSVLSFMHLSNRVIRTFAVESTTMTTVDLLTHVRMEWETNKTIAIKPGKNLAKVTLHMDKRT